MNVARLAPFVVADGLFGDAVGTRLAVLATGWVVPLCQLAGRSRVAQRIGLEVLADLRTSLPVVTFSTFSMKA